MINSSSAIPAALSSLQQRLRPLAPKISFPESRKKMIVLPEFTRVRNSARLLNCTVSYQTIVKPSLQKAADDDSSIG
jgi:hypothetical protein